MNRKSLLGKEEYSLLMGAKPLSPVLTPITSARKKEIIQWVEDENIEYKYINGSCEDRAHYICLLLQSKGISSGKIWNFAPARYTFLSNELFEMKDPFCISDSVTWGYHVAPYLLSYDASGNEEIMIIDQCFDAQGFIPMQQWLNHMNCPQAIHLLTDSESYLFNSIFGQDDAYNFSYETHYHLPIDIPSIITGNFWTLYTDDNYVQKGLAINDVALEIFSLTKKSPRVEGEYLRNVLININEVIELIEGQKPSELSSDSFNHLTKYYHSRFDHWNERVYQLKNLIAPN